MTSFITHRYITARNGVFSMNLETEEFTYMNRYCVGFLIDAHGYMWYTSNDKLVRLNVNDLSDVREISLSEIGVRFEVNKFIEYRGDIYFGTQGAGLYRYSIADDVFTPYTVSSGHLISRDKKRKLIDNGRQRGYLF